MKLGILLAAALLAAPILLAARNVPETVPFSEAQISRGAEVFVAQCVMCHGATGEEAVDWGPALHGESFWKNWEGRPTRALYSRIISTMPASEPGILEKQDVIDVVAFLTGAQPAGQSHVTDPDMLNRARLKNPEAP